MPASRNVTIAFRYKSFQNAHNLWMARRISSETDAVEDLPDLGRTLEFLGRQPILETRFENARFKQKHSMAYIECIKIAALFAMSLAGADELYWPKYDSSSVGAMVDAVSLLVKTMGDRPPAATPPARSSAFLEEGSTGHDFCRRCRGDAEESRQACLDAEVSIPALALLLAGHDNLSLAVYSVPATRFRPRRNPSVSSIITVFDFITASFALHGILVAS